MCLEPFSFFISDTLRQARTFLLFLLLTGCWPLMAQDKETLLKDLKKEASRLFEEEEYTKAYKLYAQLVANYPKDPEYNFRLGVCMIYSEPDKKKSFPYLQQALADPEKAPEDAHFFMGKAHHINYHFDEALGHYNKFKTLAPASRQKKLQVDREITACQNGKKLLSNLTDLVVQNKKQLNETDYFRTYDLKGMGGKLLVKPDDFKSSTDKKKKENSVMYLPKGGQVVFFSSYGENTATGKDIYRSNRLPNGTYSKPEKVSGINTEFDEDYPFLHPNGNALYFASKGHNSMGGYDIFKSTWDENTGNWGNPVNLEFPVNSPDDDFLFVTDSLEKTAYFSTGRQSPPGKIDVLKISTERKPIDMIVIKGTVVKESAEQSLNSVISVKLLDKGIDVGTFEAEENGDYNLELPNGAKLLFTVETPGMKTQSQKVNLPLATAAKPFKQTIAYEDGILKIINYFEEAPGDDNYKQYLKLIEKKARLEVNEGENNLAADTPLANNTPAETEQKDENPKVEEKEKEEKSPALTNEALAGMAKKDADESRQEAQQLSADAKAAFEIGNKQKEDADKKLVAAAEDIQAAERISDADEKKEKLEKANALKQEAKNEQALAAKILSLASSLEDDAKNKQREASLNEQYAAELEKAAAGKSNAASLERLTELQNELQAMAAENVESASAITALKTSISEKEKQLVTLEQQNTGLNSNLREIETAITEKETLLAKTRKKSVKEQINNELTDLRNEQADNKKLLSENETEISTLKQELNSQQEELAIAEKIRSGDTRTALNTTPAKPTEKEQTLPEKTGETAAEETPDTKTDSDAIVKEEKKETISGNDDNNAEPEKTVQPVTNNNSEKKETETAVVITATTKTEAIEKLEQLTQTLQNSAEPGTGSTALKDETLQTKRTEAASEISALREKQKQLLENIAASKNRLKEPSAVSAGNADELNKEAEVLLTSAQKLRTEAAKSSGDEKKKLETEALELEDQANDKLINAAEVAGSVNKITFDTNTGNIEGLIAAGKSSDADKAEAANLASESALAFKQALDIRAETNNKGTKGARLGNLSNAEEKEAEALLKQAQAIEILRRSNPDYELKTPVVNENADALSNELRTINSGLEDLNAAKASAYQKLFGANNEAISVLREQIRDKENRMVPAQKTSLMNADTQLSEITQLKADADNSANNGNKVSSLQKAIDLQTETLGQLQTLNDELDQAPTVSPEPAITTNEPPKEETQTNEPVKEDTQTNETPVVNNETNSQTQQNNEAQNTEPVVQNQESSSPAAENTTSDKADEDLIKQLAANTAPLKNAAASTKQQRSLTLLKQYETETNILETEMKNLSDPATDPVALSTRADIVLVESETLSAKARQTRQDADAAPAAEKDSLIRMANSLDEEARFKQLEAASLSKQTNLIRTRKNAAAIETLSEKFRNDQPERAAEMGLKVEELNTLAKQAQKLREEAESLDNIPARVGAMSNAEEKEKEVLSQQTLLLEELKQTYPDFTQPESETNEVPEFLAEKKRTLAEKQYNELKELTNAYSLEYASAQKTRSGRLTTEQQQTKARADSLNAESKSLLIRSASAPDAQQQNELARLAVQKGSQAVETLNSLQPANTTSEPAVTRANNAPAETETPAVTARTVAAGSTVKIEGLEVIRGNAYNAGKPIPMDVAVGSGLLFRVQIGAFKTQLPNDAFRGLSPLNGETTASGYFRYTAGNFNRYENANAVKNDLRGLGYSDAFVVAYYNGKRISLAEAIDLLNKEGRPVDPAAPQTAGITANTNVPRAINNPAVQEPLNIAGELERSNGLLYTIQIGVYNRQVSKQRLYSLMPVFTEQLGNGLFRYTAGIYNNIDKIVADKNWVITLGVKDAFVTAYINGKRVPVSEAKNRQANDNTIAPQAEQPVIFPSGTGLSASISAAPVAGRTTESKNYPTPTPENGVKLTEEGVCFKVQVGAYSKDIPGEIAAKLSAIKNWPIENKQVNQLYIYNIGNFSAASYAKSLKEEVIRLGIRDAFITVYRDGKKLYGAEAAELMK